MIIGREKTDNPDFTATYTVTVERDDGRVIQCSATLDPSITLWQTDDEIYERMHRAATQGLPLSEWPKLGKWKEE